MKKILLLLSLSFVGFLGLKAQRIVDIQHQETITQDELAQRFFGFPIKNGIEAFKILYETLDTDGSTIDTASGLLVLPLTEVQDQQFPFLAYQHGTAASREGVPSNIENGERLLIYYFGGQGYHTTAADYLGLGDSKRAIHPYVHADSEASAGIDLVKAARSYLEQEGISYNDQLFITGYSQGGHAGMAMHRALNNDPIEGLEVTAGSHMSGIYNVSGDLITGAISEQVYMFPSYVVWIMVGYQTVYGNLYNDLSEIFRPEFVEDISGFVDGTITRGALNGLLIETLETNYGASIPRFLFTESFLENLDNPTDSPIIQALRDNDLYDWIPNSPMRMMYCMADEQVNFTNSVFTDSIMNANGASDVLAIDVNSAADHGGCVIPATFETVLFFEQFAERPLILSTQNIDPALQFRISPNPATSYLQLKFNNASTKFQRYQLRLQSIHGQTVVEKTTENLENFRFEVNEIPSGLYLINVQSENGFWTEKVFIN